MYLVTLITYGTCASQQNRLILELRGCVHRLHLPVIEVQPKFMGIPSGPVSAIAPFRLNKEELAVYIYAYNDIMSEEYFDQCPLLGEKISPK